MAKYEVHIAKSDGTEETILPITPEELPEVSFSSDLDDFLSTSGYYTIIGPSGQPEVDAESLLPDPEKKLTFVVSQTSGESLVKLLRSAQTKQEPIQYIITKGDEGYFINRLFAVQEVSYRIDRKGDYIVSFSLKGWKEYKNWNGGKAGATTTKKTKTRIVIAPKKTTVKIGKKKTVKLRNAKGKISWKSTKPAVCYVNSRGVIKGKKKGKCKIVAVYKKKKYVCTVTVKK